MKHLRPLTWPTLTVNAAPRPPTQSGCCSRRQRCWPKPCCGGRRGWGGATGCLGVGPQRLLLRQHAGGHGASAAAATTCRPGRPACGVFVRQGFVRYVLL